MKIYLSYKKRLPEYHQATEFLQNAKSFKIGGKEKLVVATKQIKKTNDNISHIRIRRIRKNLYTKTCISF